ncbi:MAG: radical SAM protein [Leptospiraceae bacterium]|nr:radical SAM protein [Leptospiraceae bacterium]
MITSKYTFTTKKYKSQDILILNYLSGAIDLVEKEEVEELQKRLKNHDWEDYKYKDYFLERGYIFHSSEDEWELVQKKYLEFMEEYEQTPLQIIFSTSFTCNFACVYCFQEDYLLGSKKFTKEITDKFFNYINNKFANEKVQPYITLFGGEPLLPSESYKQTLLYFLEQAKQFSYPVAIITNGYELINYVPEFKRIGVNIKEIQVTVDGDKQNHDARRFTKTGKPTFDRVMDGVELALKNGYRINMRSIIDKRNMQSLPSLAQYVKDRGFLDYPSTQFETTLGRNYELHTCQQTDKLYDRYHMWVDFFELAQKYPVLKEYHKPQFHGMRYLAENGDLPFPIFDGCPAGKKEWAFDVNGYIYGCTASVGVEKFRLGSYVDPSYPVNEKQIEEWRTRDVLTISECSNCPVSLSCGGGCGVLAYNAHQKIHSTNCRPVADLVGLGAEYYKIGEETKQEVG